MREYPSQVEGARLRRLNLEAKLKGLTQKIKLGDLVLSRAYAEVQILSPA
jgi:hypothetical protein